VIRVAAVADVHVGADCRGELRSHFAHLADRADVLLLAGDLTRRGEPEEATVLADELRGLPVPTLAVLGNHDYHSDAEAVVVATLHAAGVRVLEGDAAIVDVAGERLGVAGVKGFGGGFVGASGSEFGEREMKAFMAHTRSIAEGLEATLDRLDADVRVALLHYSPVEATLRGERLEIYPFLGSYLLAEAVDRAGADLVVHGHAHNGTERGVTAAGIPVRNVAQPVLRRAYAVYCLGAAGDLGACEQNRGELTATGAKATVRRRR
jgi:Icc-related predicted phosphoesterase